MVQWLLGLGALIAEGPGPVPGWGTKILQAVQKKKKKKEIKKERKRTEAVISEWF